MRDNVFEDIVVFSREPAENVLHGVETLLSVIDFCRSDGRKWIESFTDVHMCHNT